MGCRVLVSTPLGLARIGGGSQGKWLLGGSGARRWVGEVPWVWVGEWVDAWVGSVGGCVGCFLIFWCVVSSFGPHLGSPSSLPSHSPVQIRVDDEFSLLYSPLPLPPLPTPRASGTLVRKLIKILKQFLRRRLCDFVTL